VTGSGGWHRTGPPDAVPPYLAGMYATGEDPWRISDGFYEHRKRQIVLSCLPEPNYAEAFEPGCANGELSVLLAGRCRRLLSVDIAEPAVQRAAVRLAGWPRARVRRMAVPGEWPGQRFDLVVLSEFGYYLSWPDWQAVVARTAESLTENWTVLACHWRPDFPQRLVATDALHDELASRLPGRQVLRLEDEDFRLDVFSSHSESVAGREGRR
jgi:hypothetical protein